MSGSQTYWLQVSYLESSYALHFTTITTVITVITSWAALDFQGQPPWLDNFIKMIKVCNVSWKKKDLLAFVWLLYVLIQIDEHHSLVNMVLCHDFDANSSETICFNLFTSSNNGSIGLICPLLDY